MSTEAMRFARLAHELWSSGTTMYDRLQKTVDLAAHVIASCDAATVSLSRNDALTTPVWSDPAAVDIDKLQYEQDEGPCLDALRHEERYYAEDLLSDPRWPSFGPEAAALGMRSLLSLAMIAGRTRGSLNLYARAPAAFDASDQHVAGVFSSHARDVVAAAEELERCSQLIARQTYQLDRITRVLRTRQLIDEAKGIVMDRDGVDAVEAFARLRRRARRMSLNLRDVAKRIVEGDP